MFGGSQGFPHSSVGIESACNAGDLGLVPQLGRSPGEGNSNPLHYSCLENPTDRGGWHPIVHGVARVGQDLVTKPPPPFSIYHYNPLPLVVTYQKEGCRATELPDSITGLQMPVYDCL